MTVASATRRRYCVVTEIQRGQRTVLWEPGGTAEGACLAQDRARSDRTLRATWPNVVRRLAVASETGVA